MSDIEIIRVILLTGLPFVIFLLVVAVASMFKKPFSYHGAVTEMYESMAKRGK